jgi:sortase A
MLSRVRGRSVIVPSVVLLLAVACARGPASPVVRAAPGRAAVVGEAPSTSVLPPAPPLPDPIPIPADSYAPEPVVEIGTMEIPTIGLVHRIFEGVTLHNIDNGPSLWTGSPLPGHMGNTVFAGHRTVNDAPFRRIDELVPGDPVIFKIGGVTTRYRVTGHLIVSPADSWIADQSTAYTGTLYACHPLGSQAQRYVVRLELAV